MVEKALNSNWNKLGFSNHLEVLNIVQKENLIPFQIYCSVMPEHPEWESLHIFRGNLGKKSEEFQFRLYISDKYKGDRFDKSLWGCAKSYRESTKQEKHWLKECIRLNKFITFEEVMETFNKKINYEIW